MDLTAPAVVMEEEETGDVWWAELPAWWKKVIFETPDDVRRALEESPELAGVQLARTFSGNSSLGKGATALICLAGAQTRDAALKMAVILSFDPSLANVATACGLTPLTMACLGDESSGSLHCVEVLLDGGAEPNAIIERRHGLRCPMSAAVLSGNLQTMTLLCARGCDVNLAGLDDVDPHCTAIGQLVSRGCERRPAMEILEHLLGLGGTPTGACVNYAVMYHRSSLPLHGDERPALLRRLLDTGAPPNQPLGRYIPLQRCKDHRLTEILLEYGASCTDDIDRDSEEETMGTIMHCLVSACNLLNDTAPDCVQEAKRMLQSLMTLDPGFFRAFEWRDNSLRMSAKVAASQFLSEPYASEIFGELLVRGLDTVVAAGEFDRLDGYVPMAELVATNPDLGIHSPSYHMLVENAPLTLAQRCARANNCAVLRHHARTSSSFDPFERPAGTPSLYELCGRGRRAAPILSLCKQLRQGWAPSRHHLYPLRFRQAAQAVMWLSTNTSVGLSLPREMWYIILSLLPRSTASV